MPWFRSKSFEDYIIDLKLKGKELERQAKRCEKQQVSRVFVVCVTLNAVIRKTSNLNSKKL